MSNLTVFIGAIQPKDSGGDANDTCNPAPVDQSLYNLKLRIVSVVVLLIVSFVGASMAVLSSRVKFFRISPVIINTGKFFGTGVILATGLIHMFPSATEALTDPCLPDGWLEYDALSGLFAMIAILVMQLIEFIAHHQLHRVTHENESSAPKPAGSQSVVSPIEQCEQELGHSHGGALLQETHNHKVSTYLLELGVASHSVLIGVALGTNDPSTFVALFIAISFHQFFEAIALGAQIAKLNNKSIIPAMFLIIIYTLTTPVGIAIGIGVTYGSYNPESVGNLLANGILDSLAAGILIYVSLVNLMAGEMGVGAHAFFALKKRYKILYFGALYLGAAAMAVIGRWA